MAAKGSMARGEQDAGRLWPTDLQGSESKLCRVFEQFDLPEELFQREEEEIDIFTSL